MTVLNNNFFTSQRICIDNVIKHQFYISNRPSPDTNTIITSMKNSDVIASFSNMNLDVKIIMKEFIAGYNTINKRYYYKIHLCAQVINKTTPDPEEYIELYNDTFSIYDITQILWLLNTINEYIDKSFSKTPVMEHDISLICFLVDYLIILSLVEFPRNGI